MSTPIHLLSSVLSWPAPAPPHPKGETPRSKNAITSYYHHQPHRRHAVQGRPARSTFSSPEAQRVHQRGRTICVMSASEPANPPRHYRQNSWPVDSHLSRRRLLRQEPSIDLMWSLFFLFGLITRFRLGIRVCGIRERKLLPRSTRARSTGLVVQHSYSVQRQSA